MIAFDQDQAALDRRIDRMELRTPHTTHMAVDATRFGTAGRYPAYHAYIHDRSSEQNGLVEEAIGFDVYPAGTRVRDLEYTGVMCEVDGASEHYKVYSRIAV